MKSVESLLGQLGLAAEEIKIYLISLRKGALTLQQLQKELDLSLLSVNSAVNELIDKKLMTRVTKNSKDFIQAEHPEKVINQLQQSLGEQQRALDDLKNYQAELESDMSPDIPRVRFFEGKQGLFEIIEDFNGMNHPEAYLIFPPGRVFETFTEEERNLQQQRRLSRKIKTKCIKAIDGEHIPNKLMSEEIIISLEDFPIHSDISIYDNKVAIASLVEPYHGIILESSSIADSLRSIFHLAWLGAQNISDERRGRQK